MTNSSTFKKHVRAYAAEHDLSYTEARRRLTAGISDLGDESLAATVEESIRAEATKRGISYEEALALFQEGVEIMSGPGQEPLTETALKIQRETQSDGRLPYPFYVHPSGQVRRQDHWKGEPYFLIGFQDPNRTGENLAVSRDDWFADPDSAIGMQAVFKERTSDGERDVVYEALVASVTAHEMTMADPQRAVLTTAAVGVGVVGKPIPVGHLLEFLTPADLSAAEQAAWVDCEAIEELLWMASLRDDAEAENLLDALDEMDRGLFTMTVTGPGVGKPGADETDE